MKLHRSSRALACFNLLVLFLCLALLRPAARPPAFSEMASNHRPYLQWIRHGPPAQSAWPDQPRLQFDAADKPAILGNTVFIGSTVTDSVAALDLQTGAEKWRFFTEGPVRFAPVVRQDRVFAASDDGYLYCLDAATGRLHWKFRGGPSDRKILGNQRLISTWPARGAPAVADGTVYFAAGIWPFMGIFIHAIDARTGEVVWTNSGDGSIFIAQPHYAEAFGGVAPQGPLVVAGDRLLVPGGRSVPACYDRRTGKLLYYHLADYSKVAGGAEVTAQGSIFANGGALFEVETGDYLGEFGQPMVLEPEVVYAIAQGECRAYDLKGAANRAGGSLDRRCRGYRWSAWELPRLAAVPVPKVTAMTRMGSRLYLAATGHVFAFDLPLRNDSVISWQTPIDGTPVHLVGEGGRLLVNTREGRLYCFGPNRQADSPLSAIGASFPTPSTSPARALRHRPPIWRTGCPFGGQGARFLWENSPISAKPPLINRTGISHNGTTERRSAQSKKPTPRQLTPPARQNLDRWREKAALLLQTTNVRAGFCIAWGIGTGSLIVELARQSDLRIIAVEPDAAKADASRHRLAAGGLAGERVAVVSADAELPPYFASLMVAEEAVPANREFMRKLFRSLRPYGGVACLPMTSAERRALTQWLADDPSTFANAKLREAGDWFLLSREGPLPGAADWTHEHADAANTRVSRDRLVRAPLGLLWFGGPPHNGMLPRHGHGPQPQVLGGRIIAEGVDRFRALDVYTGRLLWETPLPGVGAVYDNDYHQPGANAGGANYVSTADGIYIAYGQLCVRLDPATGKRLQEFSLPARANGQRPDWGYINVSGDFLIGGARLPLTAKDRNVSLASSKQLVVMDRRTGKVRWTTTARIGFRHNAICIGGGRLYCIDRGPGGFYSLLRRHGEVAGVKSRLSVFDLATGRKIWHTENGVFGTWLSYSAPRDVLVESGRMARDALYDEPVGMRAYRAGSGKILWHDKEYVGPAMIHGDIILKERSACELLTGAPVMRNDPLTGLPVEWTWSRGYGCNTPAASQHLLTFRSGAAGYFDLAGDGGTANLGGFRASCTNNLIVADGVLAAPDYTRGCTCSYQNQCSVAFVPMPDAEMWTYYGPRDFKDVVGRVGINLGAPGNRRAENGTLWLEHPPVGGPSARLPITTVPEHPDWFRRHSSLVEGEGLKWVAASGAKGLRSLTVTLSDEPYFERFFTVRLHFLEPDRLGPNQRLFDVALQGRTVLRGLDISRSAGGPNRPLVREFRGIAVTKDLTVTLTPADCAGASEPVLCGVEIAGEW